MKKTKKMNKINTFCMNRNETIIFSLSLFLSTNTTQHYSYLVENNNAKDEVDADDDLNKFNNLGFYH